MTIHCPKCDADISESFEPTDYSCGINGGWYCDACDLGIAEWEVEREPLDGDVPTGPSPRDPSEPIGTPLSELHGRPEYPGDPKYAEWVRICKSWGHD